MDKVHKMKVKMTCTGRESSGSDYQLAAMIGGKGSAVQCIHSVLLFRQLKSMNKSNLPSNPTLQA